MQGKQNGPKRRRRRSADDARRAILDAAERHLAEGGIQGVKLNAVASDLGVTHQAILRHFGSREELLRALLRRAGARLRDELRGAAAGPHQAPDLVGRLADAVGRTFRATARLSAWLLLSGRRTHGSGLFREAIDAIEGRRGAAARRSGPDDARFAVYLLALVAWAEPLAGESLQRAADLPGDDATAERFRSWLIGIVEARLFGAARPD
jgi:TetR/AcrR family transcriptional regulator, repressor for neighboring sulfatase